jgi:hypothetical protein
VQRAEKRHAETESRVDELLEQWEEAQATAESEPAAG